MKDILVSVIGEYVANDSLSGIGQLDVPWILAAITVVIGIYCVFRLIGGIFSAK